MRLRGPKMDLGLEAEDSPGFSFAETLLGRLGRRRRQRIRSCSDAGAQPAVPVPRSPPVITRVDRPWTRAGPELPMLDIEEIIRHRDQRGPQTPASTSQTDSAQTAVDSESTDGPAGRSSTSTGETRADARADARASWRLPSMEFFARPSTSRDAGRRRPRHDYFRVATMDGVPTIGAAYRCPIAVCQAPFARFEELQEHWNQHPWNRGGILTPVCDGGVRRLGWWEHKRKFFASLVQGKSALEFPEDRDALRRRRSKSIDEVCRSDYGDISLFGSRTYHVSPRVVPMWQVAQWEAARALA
ncbi:hypothetical protein J3B02_001385 [Coemansia erecta]|uniref:C2H2-type domain-containing protein n=1 Tax=Coemansia asiatica TaxID=1052880 RepID=A0A9W7XJ72_9FUNG|nr:hypothetical protein LPJ64_003969 [Coemansia asiatica]KAJ2856830.1 hypothetical protein J3B02_001385 [Coemansia erecta]KAJ2889075.1 hypothetical protein FB639_000163 [Coemansia asiatica]